MHPPRPRLLGLATLLMLASACQPESVFCPQRGNMPQFICPPGTRCAASQDICIYDSCGDGIVDPGEVCDDGNKNSGDGCKADCKSDETCGNRVVDTAVGEVCDDGNTVSGDKCSSDCLSAEGCGNGRVDTAIGEACDDGNTDAGDDCTDVCQFGVCGDAIVKVSGRNVEECDDGRQTAACDSDCTFPACGDGLVNGSAGETCDEGALPGCDGDAGTPDLCDTSLCDGRLATTGNACTIAFCGDGYRNAKAREECDTAGESATCNLNCKLARCGDGLVNVTAGEQCDQNNGVDTATCDGDTAPAGQKCTGVVCGDGYRNSVAREGCDDGNSDNNDDCTNACHPALCGDSIVDLHGSNVEECDTGAESASCDGPDAGVNACTVAECGDGHVNTEAGETCDVTFDTNDCDGPPAGGQKCTQAQCGDGYTNADAGEECDDGNTDAGDDCTDVCRNNACGDGFRDLQAPRTEECDDHNTDNETQCPYGETTPCTFCNSNCSAEIHLPAQYCGDRVVQGPPDAGEACDDGNAEACGTCSASCGARRTPRAATGRITSIVGPLFKDKDYFTINDGLHPSISFEINKSGGVTAGRVMINIYDSQTAAQTAEAIKNAINNPTLNLWITATTTGTEVVSLTHDRQSALGNRTITETVGSNEFNVSGMSGGLAGDCGSGTGCSLDADCSPLLACDGTTHTCKVPVPPPTFSGTEPASPANETNPSVTGTSEPGATVRIYGDATCTGQALGVGVADAGGNFSIPVTVGDNSTSTFFAQATDGVGSLSACSTTSVTYVEDSTPPASPTFTGSNPASPANNTNPNIEGLTEADSTVRLYTDGSCTGAEAGNGTATDGGFSIAVTVADGGTTTFRATATDIAGNPSGCSTSSLTYVEVP